MKALSKVYLDYMKEIFFYQDFYEKKIILETVHFQIYGIIIPFGEIKRSHSLLKKALASTFLEQYSKLFYL